VTPLSPTAGFSNAVVMTVEMEVNFEFNTTDGSQVMVDQNFLSFAKVQVGHAFGSVQQALGSNSTVVWTTDTVPLTDLQLSDDPDLIKHTKVTDRGTTILTLPFKYEFRVYRLDENTEFLSLRAFCYLDMEDIADAYNIDAAIYLNVAGADLDGTEDYARGSITYEPVVVNNKIPTSSPAYIIAGPDEHGMANHAGEQWLGEVNTVEVRGQAYLDAYQTESGNQAEVKVVYITPEQQQTSADAEWSKCPLDLVMVPVSKIVDLRFASLFEIEPTFQPVGDILSRLIAETKCTGKATPATQIDSWFNDASPYSSAVPRFDSRIYGCIPDRSITVNSPDSFLSEAYISRDVDGNCTFLFHLDYDRILREKSQFGGLINAENLLAIKNRSRIQNLKVVRRRVKRVVAVNRLGSPVEGSVTDEYDNLTEVIVESHDTGIAESTSVNQVSMSKPVVLMPSDSINKFFRGKIKEASSLQTLDGNILMLDGIRTFNVSDYSITGKDFGLTDDDILSVGTGEVVSQIIPPKASAAPASPTGIFYQYGIELEIEDGTIAFLNSMLYANDPYLIGLFQLRENLLDYHSQVDQFKMSKRFRKKLSPDYQTTEWILKQILVDNTYSPDPTVYYYELPEYIEYVVDIPKYKKIATKANNAENSGNDAAAAAFRMTLPWNHIPLNINKIINNILSEESDDYTTGENSRTQQIKNLLEPNLVTLESINSVIQLVDNLISKIQKGLGTYAVPAPTNISSTRNAVLKSESSRRVITVKKFFNNVFDASKPKDMHIDFFGNNGTSASLYGMKMSDYTKLADDEIKTYWAYDTQEAIKNNSALTLPYHPENKSFDEITNVTKTKWSTRTAANISLGENMQIPRLNAGLPLWNTSPQCQSNGIRGANKWCDASNIAVAANMGDYIPKMSGQTDNGVAALKHILNKVGVKVIPTPVPKFIQTNKGGINTAETKILRATDIFGEQSTRIATENLRGVAGVCESETITHEEEKRFSTSLPIVQKWANNLAFNGAFAARDRSQRITNPHVVIPPPMKKELYDLNNTNNIIEMSRESAIDPSFVADIPGPISSMLAADTDASMFLDTPIDPSQDPSLSPFMLWNFGLMSRVEVLAGFEQDSCKIESGTSSGCGHILKKPIFKKLDEDTWTDLFSKLNASSAAPTYVLCRVVPEENSSLGILPAPGIALPVLNEFFTLSKEEANSIPEWFQPTKKPPNNAASPYILNVGKFDSLKAPDLVTATVTNGGASVMDKLRSRYADPAPARNTAVNGPWNNWGGSK
jgi:hypothetical protein